jgi:hypothetical protein
LEFGNANVAMQRTSNLLVVDMMVLFFKSSNMVLDSQAERMRVHLFRKRRYRND